MPWSSLWSSSTSTSSSSQKENDLTEKISNLKHEVEEKVGGLQKSATRAASEVSDISRKNGWVSSFVQPSTLISTTVLTATILTFVALQRRYARRIPNATSVPQTYILPSQRRFTRSLFGRVTTVGDADNFRIYHTPLGLLGLWHTLRHVPSDPKLLKNNTVHIRLAGIDAPELSHFGRPAQPYSSEALDWLTAYVRGRRVRCYVHKADQYGRVVATAYVRKGLLRRDVGLQMLKAGFATVYEAKSGAEFASKRTEEKYREIEQWAKNKKKGMWQDEKLESPREYKNRFRDGTPS